MSATGSEQSIFLHAIGLGSAAARAAYLDEACHGDPSLRADLEALLVAHERLGSRDEGSTATSAPEGGNLTASYEPPPVSAGAFIAGRYKLLEEIGEGGMGSVWMAEQTEPVQRRVAIKLIKPGMDSRQVVARFEAERQALALMDHPNIAKVLDGGATPDGRPFFVMELVKGTPITKFCDEKRLNVRERLELFGDVCRAVQHAHQKGIIHRDLKPSNVLVAPYDGRPVVKVIDFGVAKATGQKLTEATLFTGFGAVVGTPEYMSPEQAEVNNQDIDTRSDIYSLGVLLYELLTGSTPLTRKRARDAALLEVLRVIREEEAPRPSTRLSSTEELPSISAQRQSEPAKLTKLVRGELDWIVMKALEKDRNRRYETANGFAMDVQRYLSDEAVQACPPSAGYRFRKFARRNRGRLVAASVLALAALVATSGIGWAVRDRSARQAEAERERNERQARVTTQVELVLADVDRLMEAQKWPEALSTAKRAEAALASGDADDAMREKVADVIRDLQFVERLENARLLREAPLDGAFDNVGAERAYCAAFAEAGLNLTAPESVESFVGRWLPRSAIRLAVASGLDGWAFCKTLIPKKKEDWLREEWLSLVQISRRIDPDPLRNRIREIWWQKITPEQKMNLQKFAQTLEVENQSPETILVLAQVLNSHELQEVTRSLLRRAQVVHAGNYSINYALAQLLKDKPREAEIYSRVLVGIAPQKPGSHINLGYVLYETQKRRVEAIACFRRALALDPKNVNAMCNIGTLSGDEDGIAWFRKAIELDPDLGVAHYNLGCNLARLKRFNEAEACFRRAVDLNPKDTQAFNNLGAVLNDLGKNDEAIGHFLKAIEINPKHASAHYNLANRWRDQNRMEDAIAEYKIAIESDSTYPDPHFNLGNLLLDQKKYDEAITHYRAVIKLKPDFAAVYVNLGNALKRQKKFDEAIASYKVALELDPNLSVAHINLAQSYQDLRRIGEAIPHYRKAIELDPKDAGSLGNLAWHLVAADDPKARNPKEGLELARRSVAIRSGWWNLDTLSVAAYRNAEWQESLDARLQMVKLKPARPEDKFFLAMNYWKLGKQDEAKKWHAEAAAEYAKIPKPDKWLSEVQAEAEALIRGTRPREREPLTIPPRPVK